MLETTRIRRDGFAIRLPFKDFLLRYRYTAFVRQQISISISIFIIFAVIWTDAAGTAVWASTSLSLLCSRQWRTAICGEVCLRGPPLTVSYKACVRAMVAVGSAAREETRLLEVSSRREAHETRRDTDSRDHDIAKIRAANDCKEAGSSLLIFFLV